MTQYERDDSMMKTLSGEIMFAMEDFPDGSCILNEYTDDGIIKHEFPNRLALEIWVFKYRGVTFH